MSKLVNLYYWNFNRSVMLAIISLFQGLTCSVHADDLKCIQTDNIYYYYTDPPADFVSTLVLVVYQSDFRLGDDRKANLLQWSQIAAKHHLAFMCLFAKYDDSLFPAMQNGTVPPDTADAIEKAAFTAFGKPTSFCFFPYDDWRDSLALAVGLTGAPNIKIAGWGLTDCLPPVTISTQCPSLLIATDDFRLLPELKEYYKGQKHRTRRASLVIYKPADYEKLRDFVCQYFEAAADKPEGVWSNIDTNLPTTSDDLGATWLPTDGVATAWAGLQTKMIPRPTIVEQSIDPESPGTVPLQFYLRLPLGETDGSQVSGVLAYCTWEQDRVSIEQDLMVDTNRIGKQSQSTSVEMVKYATEHNLALLTWSTPGNWNPQVGNDALSDSERSREDRLFDNYARAWDQGVDRLVQQTGVPSTDYLLYGFSRGAQWAHRLALRRPDRFLAINVHVSSSYDVPTPEAAQCLWLVTTGDLEHGYAMARDFYAQCCQLGYPVMFKAEENLGHNTCIEVDQLRDDFFDYALQLKQEEYDKGLDKAGIIALAAQRLTSSPLIGDVLNQDLISPSDSQALPPSQLVRLPNYRIAQAWATVHVPEQN